MAYVKQYEGGFYNRDRNPISVEFYHDNGVAEVKQIKLAKCVMKGQLEGNIITQSVDISLYNTFAYHEFKLLLENYERQWMCLIKNNADETLFQGYLLVDVQEQQLRDTPSRINLTFSDHLKRMKGFNPTLTIDAHYSLLALLFTHCIFKIDSRDVFINSSLYHDAHATTGTFLEQSFILGELFYLNNVEIMKAWDIVQTILHDFNLYLYIYKNNYYLERYNSVPHEDIESTAGWKKADKTTLVITAQSNLKQEIESASYHIETETGIVAYHSGISDFELDIDHKVRITIVLAKDNFVLYTYSGCIDVWPIPPPPSLLPDYNTWYYPSYLICGDGNYPQGETLAVTETTYGENEYGMMSYVRGTYALTVFGLWGQWFHIFAYKTRITFGEKDTRLRLQWKLHMIRPTAYSEEEGAIYVRFMLLLNPVMFQGSPSSVWLAKDEEGEVEMRDAGSMNPYIWEIKMGNNQAEGNLFEFSHSLDFSKLIATFSDINLFIYFMPVYYTTTTSVNQATWGGSGIHKATYAKDLIIGDIYIHIEDERLDNLYLYDINQGFINQEKGKLIISDVASLTYSNGVMLSDGTRTTGGWEEPVDVEQKTLVDRFIQSIIGFAYKTRKELKGVFLFKTDTLVKPLSIFKSSVFPGEKFILFSYVWDMIRNAYQIEAKEHSDEAGDINIIE